MSMSKDEDVISIEDLENLHRIVYELSKVSIDSLTSIIPILEEELKVPICN